MYCGRAIAHKLELIGFSLQIPLFSSAVVCVGLVMNKVALGQVFLKPFKFSLTSYHSSNASYSLLLPLGVQSLNYALHDNCCPWLQNHLDSLLTANAIGFGSIIFHINIVLHYFISLIAQKSWHVVEQLVALRLGQNNIALDT